MPENLTAADVATYTRGRLSADDPETTRALNAALARVRRYCGWHVSPRVTETLTLDGRGGRELELPTLKLVSLASITEDGAEVDLSTVRETAPGILARPYGWTYGVAAIEVELTHGYTAAEAHDFRQAVLACVDMASVNVGTGATGAIVAKTIDDVAVQWSTAVASVQLETAALAAYKLLSFA